MLSGLLLAGSFSLSRPADPQWLDVPFVRQVKAGCGSAAVAMVMQYWVAREHGLDAAASDAGRIHKLLYSPKANGIPGKSLEKYLKQHGFQAFAFNGELRDLRQHLDKGRPVMVCLGLKGPRAPLHYVVVVGMEDNAVLLNDPARGKLVREDLDVFEPAWKATGNWTLLAVPQQIQ